MHRPSSGSSRLTTWTAVCVLLHVTATRWTTLLPGAGAVSVVALRPDANAYTELEGHEIDDTDSSFTIPLLDSYRQDGDLQAASADPPSHNHSNWCIIRKESYVFDLCPLLAPERYTDKPDPGNGDEGGDSDDQGKQQRFVKRIEVKRDTPPTVTHTHYYLSLRGKLDMSSKRWKGRECPEGTWICGIVVNYEHDGEKETGMRLLQVIPIAGNLPLEEGHSREAHGLNATSRLGRAQETARHRELHVILHGGMYAGKNQSALIAFQCDHKADEEKPSSPTYSWTYNGFHVFTWQSKHACATRHAVPAEPEPEPTPSGPDPTPETPPDDSPHLS
ncbi:hypothetical protein SCHPADRAFT_642559 [Schizopora paradoxa]|uniref:Autophagy-related protein 27 n=1 Tax=Schizopora paradoxa TaxID=27342 RepID=A0A0H2RDG6_9AGAM|nr:hypothetical protein SCHPADRAFT_642559 [Schizopora paradoxa]